MYTICVRQYLLKCDKRSQSRRSPNARSYSLLIGQIPSPHDFFFLFFFSPEKDCSTLMAFRLDSSTVPPSFSNSTRQAKDRTSSMDNKKGPFKVLVTGVGSIQNTFTSDL